MSILIIDDERFICDVASKILQRAGYTVVCANTSTKGIEVFTSLGDIELVLLDFHLPDASGVITLRALRQLRPGIRCILSSGTGIEASDIPADLTLGTFFLAKPYRSATLIDTVASVLASSIIAES